MDYINKVLGIVVKYEKWDKIKELPYYLTTLYKFKLAHLDAVRALFVYPQEELTSIVTLKKHIDNLHKIENIFIVLCYSNVTYRLKRQLIGANIPFVDENKQIYLPFMGVLLQERYSAKWERVERFQPTTQMVLLYYVLKSRAPMYVKDAADLFNVSSMTISRCITQLEKTGLFEIYSEGRKKFLKPVFDGEELFNKAKDYLINPVKRIVYAPKEEAESLLRAGETALAEKSMLGYPYRNVYATVLNERVSKYNDNPIVDEDMIEIQVWKYNPNILSKDGCVDVLSLSLCFDVDEDVRVEGAVEEMLESFWEEYNGHRDKQI